MSINLTVYSNHYEDIGIPLVYHTYSQETVQQYIKDGETGKWVINPKWQEENSNQESDEPSETPAYLQNILAQKRRITKDKLEAVNKKWEEDYIPIITESSKL